MCTEEASSRLSTMEVRAALAALSPADWHRVRIAAERRSAGVGGWTPEDLLQEVMTVLLEGKRRWPRDVHPVTVLAKAMQSIASNARSRNQNGPIDEGSSIEPHESDDPRPAVLGTLPTTPEDEVSSKQRLNAVFEAVKGDEDAELLLLAWADGLRGADAMAELDWNDKKHDAARKRLMRKLRANDEHRSAK